MENDDCFADRGRASAGARVAVGGYGVDWGRREGWEDGMEKEGVGDKRLWNKEEEGGRGTDEQAIERRFQNRLIKQNMRGEHARPPGVEQGTIERTSVHDERGGERLRLCRFVLHHSALSNIC